MKKALFLLILGMTGSAWAHDVLEDANNLTRGKIPALVLVFNKRGVAPYYDFRQAQEWVAIPRWKFEQLTRHWKKS